MGDIVDTSGKIRSTIEERKRKGYGIVAEILAIVNDIPLGKYKMEIGLKLRKAMLLNSLLFNSEAWHDITEKEIKLLEVVDEHLLRSLAGAHSKTPLEFLYLETGSVPVRFILACRRMIYLQTILKRPDTELTKQIYLTQKEKPTKGDFYCLVVQDFEAIREPLNEKDIANKSKLSHKNNIKHKTRNAAFEYLKEKQSQHSKIKDVQYKSLETQQYMTSTLFNNTEVCLLFALRSRYIDCKTNFRYKYKNDDLLCQLCGQSEDNQPHLLQCKILSKYFESEEKVEYNDIFSCDLRRQKLITTIFSKLLKLRKILTTNPSVLDEMLKNRYNLQKCIVNVSFGN